MPRYRIKIETDTEPEYDRTIRAKSKEAAERDALIDLFSEHNIGVSSKLVKSKSSKRLRR